MRRRFVFHLCVLFAACRFDASAVAASALQKQSIAQPAVEFDRDDDSDLIFDSGLIVGLGTWNAPALPRLIQDERLERLDIENYEYTSSGNFLLFETRLFFPFEVRSFPIGLTLNTSNWVAETPAFPFTLTPQKGRVRPSYLLGLSLGLRSDFILAGMRSESGLELSASRMMYLGASLTSLAPLLRFRLASDRLLVQYSLFGLRPAFAVEVFGSPFVSNKGFDNRLATDSSGVVRNFSDFIELSPESTGYMYGFQVDFGLSWPALDRGREHTVFFTWSFSSSQYKGVLTRTLTEPAPSVEKIDADSTQNNFALSLRSAFK